MEKTSSQCSPQKRTWSEPGPLTSPCTTPRPPPTPSTHTHQGSGHTGLLWEPCTCAALRLECSLCPHLPHLLAISSSSSTAQLARCPPSGKFHHTVSTTTDCCSVSPAEGHTASPCDFQVTCVLPHSAGAQRLHVLHTCRMNGCASACLIAGMYTPGENWM